MLIGRGIDVTQKTAWFMLYRIRHNIKEFDIIQKQSKLHVFDKTNVNGEFLFKEVVRCNGRERVDNEDIERAMNGVFNLGRIQLKVESDSFYNFLLIS